ncbi:MAG: GHMP kinase [Rhizobiaceae bacterium]|nr:GHMP kinase [Rhizobiaceae bacterium]
MTRSVTIRVPSRLHLGFLDPSGGTGRRFGSLGLPLSEPETVVTLSRSSETSVEGPEADRAARHLALMTHHLGIRGQHRLVIEDAIPRHAGLGSGTQIALAVAASLRTLHGLALDTDNDAMLLSRGARSGVGIASFADGGVIVDAGNDGSGRPPPVVARLPFPEDWRVLLILDRTSDGLHGDAELAAFRALPVFPQAGVDEIARLVLLGVLPALVNHDFSAFGEAVGAIQQRVGTHFAPAQGGIFTSSRVEAIAHRLASLGASGIGQSSWGPTGFAFAADAASAQSMIRELGSLPDGVAVHGVSGRNRGAEIASTELGLVGS